MDSQIEAILFYKNEPISIKEIGKLLGVSTEEAGKGVLDLKRKLEDGNRGLTLIQEGENMSLATAPEMVGLIEKIAKEELSKEIGKAGLETLSVILYKGAVSRREIDYIRGVNSNFILRNLLTRGLVERVENKADARSYLYKPTVELLAHLGLQSIDKLPEFEALQSEIKAIEETKETDHE